MTLYVCVVTTLCIVLWLQAFSYFNAAEQGQYCSHAIVCRASLSLSLSLSLTHTHARTHARTHTHTHAHAHTHTHTHAHTAKPGFFKPNWLWLGKTLIQLKRSEGKEWLQKLMDAEAENIDEKEVCYYGLDIPGAHKSPK